MSAHFLGRRSTQSHEKEKLLYCMMISAIIEAATRAVEAQK